MQCFICRAKAEDLWTGRRPKGEATFGGGACKEGTADWSEWWAVCCVSQLWKQSSLLQPHTLLNAVSVVAVLSPYVLPQKPQSSWEKHVKHWKKNSLSFSVIRTGSHSTFVFCTALSATAFCFHSMFLSVVHTNSFLHYFESGPDSGWVECGMVWRYECMCMWLYLAHDSRVCINPTLLFCCVFYSLCCLTMHRPCKKNSLN